MNPQRVATCQKRQGRRWGSFAHVVLALFVSACSAPGPPAAFGPVPSERQLAWHELEYYAFVHFGPNTFTDVEWGHGDEEPGVFNPVAFDARQWARTFRDAGMQGVVITAKHHDGFALWPSAYSTHTVRESPWRNGEGDVLAELSAACAEFGLKFGVYLSPWDRNHPLYGTPEYNDVFKAMLTEVLTGYGPVFEVWFDGANGEGPNGKKQEYDFPGFAEVVRRHQPDAVIFSDAGPDIRWVGNEQGYAGETNWSTVRDGAFYPGIPGVNDQLERGHEDGDIWLPTEVDVSIRPGWFYHADEDSLVKTVSRLADIWIKSVGRNANLLLNIPVDPRGLVHENDAARLLEFKAWRDLAFRDNLASSSGGASNSVRGSAHGPDAALDGDPQTFWAAAEEIREADLTIPLAGSQQINAVFLREYIALGQRVRSFQVEALTADGWRLAGEGTTIGNRRLLPLTPMEASSVRIRFWGRAEPLISDVQVFNLPAN